MAARPSNVIRPKFGLGRTARLEVATVARDCDLKASGLGDPKVIKKLRLTTVLDQRQTEAQIGLKGAVSYEIPYFDLAGKATGFSRWKVIGCDDHDVPLKYYQEPKTIPRVYIPPLTDWKKIAKDTRQRIVLTEGEKKAACACQHKIPTLGLGGVWNWKSKKWDFDMIPDFDQFDWRGRDVELCYDGDLYSNENVRRASDSLLAKLMKRGANVFVRRLPNTDGADALDTFLVHHGVERYHELECAPWRDNIVDPPQDPLPNAHRILKAEFAHPDHALLVNQGNAFYKWDGTCWPMVEDAGLRSHLYHWAADKSYLLEFANGVKQASFMPDRNKIANLIDALRSATFLDEKTPAQSWLDGRTKPPASELISCRNGLLHWPTRKLHNHTPLHYGRYSLPFDFDPKASQPKRWLAFLKQLWPNDQESVATLQQWFGYMISGDTRLQKIFLIIGPPRGGKGTIGRILAAVMGRHNVAGPTLASFSGEFGLWPLIDKPVAIISDARLGRNDNSSIVTERLLSISGEDVLSVNRKNLSIWTGRIPARILILTNELPRFTDSSGAMANRFVVLRLTESWLGRENTALTDELSSELPGILNWSLDGLRALRKLRQFTQPSAGQEAISDMEDLGSPVKAFIRECCVIGPTHVVTPEEVFGAWRTWCMRSGHQAGAKETFGKNLRAAMPALRRRQRGSGKNKRWVHVGLTIKPSEEKP